ncbi:MAG TPA: triple tyrosine motif-containing protein [Puia sp.]|nr:triple tyrosine motif-containing protein [Puia sp.]
MQLYFKYFIQWLIGFCFLIPEAAISQNTAIALPLITNYAKTDFRGGAQTWEIAQDSRGIMYFANNEGLLTFDGNFWRNYPLPNKTIVRSLAIDANDRIYVGGQDEIGYFYPGENGILTFTSLKDKIPAQYRSFADVWQITISNDAVFFRTTDRIFEYSNNIIEPHIPHAQWDFIGEAGETVYALDGSTGLLKFHQKSWLPLKNSKALAGILIANIFSIENNKDLIVTKTAGLFILENDSISKISVTLYNNLFINVAIQINKSEFAIGTASQGYIIFNRSFNILQRFSTNEGLQNNNALSAYIDKYHNLWMGLGNGISCANYNSPIKYIAPDKANVVAGYSTRIFDHCLYLSTTNGVYALPIPAADSDLSDLKGNFSLVKNTTNGEAWQLDEVNKQLLLAHHNGSYIIENNEAKPLSQGTGSWLFLPASSVYPARNILVGTYTGIKLLQYDDGKFYDKGLADGLQDSYRYMVMDNNGDVWASHPYRGVYRMRFSPDKKKYTSQLFTEQQGLPATLNNYVFKIRNRIVFATVRGIYEYNAVANRFEPSKLLSPIFGDMEVRYLTEDPDNNIWFCSGKKIGVVSPSLNDGSGKPVITYFPEITGQILSGFENIYPYNKENVFIGSEEGVIHLNFQKYAATHAKITALIGTVKITGKKDSVIFGGYQHNTTENPDKNKPLKLFSGFNSFHFEYSSPAYGLQKSIEYSYALDGYDNEWSAWSNKTEKDYTNLPDGHYVFKIKARDNLKNESAVVSYHFIISPPWYKTIWAIVLYFFIVLLFIFLIHRRVKRKMQLQHQKFQEEQTRLKYIHQLELEKSEKEIIKLQNEKLAQEVLLKKKELANVSMHLVENADTLAKIKEEVGRIHNTPADNGDIKRIASLLKESEKSNSNWEMFAIHFDELNDDFLKKIKKKYPELTNSDLKVCAYLKLSLSTKEIAQLLNISIRGAEVSRYRIRKKLGIQTEQSLSSFLNSI